MRIFISLLFLLCSFAVLSQEGRLAAFNAVRLDRSNVDIRWTMKANVSCESPQVERSLDGVSFQSIYTYPGVCGGGTDEESFNWIDEDPPINADIYYRLKIDDGEFSKIDLVERPLLLDGQDVFVFPNPIDDQFFVNYQAELGQLDQLNIYNSSGLQILSLGQGELNSTRGQVAVRLTEISRGIYLIRMNFRNGAERALKVLIT